MKTWPFYKENFDRFLQKEWVAERYIRRMNGRIDKIEKRHFVAWKVLRFMRDSFYPRFDAAMDMSNPVVQEMLGKYKMGSAKN